MPCVTVGKVYTCSTSFYFWFCIVTLECHTLLLERCVHAVLAFFFFFFINTEMPHVAVGKVYTYSTSFWKPVICNIIAENLFTSACRSTCFSDCFSLSFQWKNWITEVLDDGCETEWTKLCRKKWRHLHGLVSAQKCCIHVWKINRDPWLIWCCFICV